VLIEEQVTVLNQTPSAFYNLISAVGASGVKAGDLKLKYVIFGGEALNPLKLKTWKQTYPAVQLINMFGITETTVHVTYKEILESDTHSTLSNIGGPVPTLSTYIMDPHRKLVPFSVSGELCVGGDGVARGYLNRPELTAQRFVQNPYKPGERLYRSGDLGKLSTHGDIEYLGRIDRQVKVRGYRIEVGEIETQLLSHDEVKEAVVTLRSDENDHRSLCAYLVGSIPLGNGGIPLLKEYLSRSLPDYMIPSYFIGIDKIPLTSNGKTDRKALAGYAVSSTAPRTSRVGPANETEEKLVAIWKDVLGIDDVGTGENFFNVGGDSIKAIRLVSAANNVFKSNLKVVDIFTGNTIREIADLLNRETVVHDEEDMKKARRQIEALRAKVLNSDKMPANVEGIYPMSDIEKGMTFHAYSSMDVALYHDQFIYQRKYADFEPGTLKKALQLLMDKHPILRT
ncbi:MAG: AMP-binding protein, partial [bacterium]|nr:AMP-binding protein [bacterium]